jgi:hypothetical protein
MIWRLDCFVDYAPRKDERERVSLLLSAHLSARQAASRSRLTRS